MWEESNWDTTINNSTNISRQTISRNMMAEIVAGDVQESPPVIWILGGQSFGSSVRVVYTSDGGSTLESHRYSY
jgi:hypothetical protein